MSSVYIQSLGPKSLRGILAVRGQVGGTGIGLALIVGLITDLMPNAGTGMSIYETNNES